MPTKRKSARKQQKGRGTAVAVRGAPASGFPRFMWRTFNYSDAVVLTEGAAGGGAFQVYRTNDLYDPDFTGVGHQPMYFDQLVSSSGPYLNFVVPSAVFHFRFVNTSNTPVSLIVHPNNTTSTPASRTVAQERPGAWTMLLSPTGTQGAHVVKTLRVDNVRMAGIRRSQFESDYYGNYGTSAPLVGGSLAQGCVIAIYGTGAVVASVTVSVNIIYKAKVWGLGPETAS